MRNLLAKHRRLVIWGAAGLAVLVVLYLRSRSASLGTTAAGTSADPNAAGTAADPNAAYDSGYSAGLVASSGSTGVAGVGSSGGVATAPPPAPHIYGYGKKGNAFYSLAAWRAAQKRRTHKTPKPFKPAPPRKGGGSGKVPHR
jgi:hypothetical protein